MSNTPIMFCSHCGSNVPTSWRFCSACGEPLSASGTQLAVAADGPNSERPASAAHTSQAARWRGASLDEIETAKELTDAEWKLIAARFNLWRKKTTLTPVGRWLGHNHAWDNYFAGYSDGVEAGVDRALGISETEAQRMSEFLVEAELAGSKDERDVPKAASVEKTPNHVLKAVGALICGIGALGFIGLWASATSIDQALPNLVNLALFTAFGVAVFLRTRAATPLGWIYLALLLLMTVAHGLIPLELLQCAGLFGFLLYLRRRLPT